MEHKQFDMIDLSSSCCKSEWCVTRSDPNRYEGYCKNCYVHLYPEKNINIRHKTKEANVINYITSNFSNYTWITDKKIIDGCSRKRPDLLLDLGYQVLIIEIDEHQHSSYSDMCENKRVMELSQDIGHRPIVIIRFNPDGYKINNRKISSCWNYTDTGSCVLNKSKKNEWKMRLNKLSETIKYWIDGNNVTEKTIEMIKLFYDE